MPQNDIMQIMVGDYSVGVIGLKEAMEETAAKMADALDEKVGAELLEKLSRRNYIPDRAKENYQQAFVREYRKFIGKACDGQEAAQGLTVKVLGMGCAQCDRLEQEVISAMAETGLTGDVEHVRDIRQIGKYGVMGSPALIITGKVISVGKVPPRAQLIRWLKEATKNGEEE